MKNTQNRKIYKKSVIKIASISALVVVLIVGGAFGIKKIFFTNIYAKYEAYDDNTKKIGDMQHYTEDTDTYYLSFYYPVFHDKTLDALVTSYKKDLPTHLKSTGKYVVSVDYDAQQLYKHYTTLTFKQKVYNKDDGKLISSSDVTYNYDNVEKKTMNVDDVLRRNYMDMIQTKAKENGIKEDIKHNQLNTFDLHDKDVTFYIGGNPKNKITVNYEQNKQFIKLHDKNIPSYYQSEPIQPAKEPTVDPNKPMIAITFDDGPHPEYTQKIMSEFEKYNGRTTFFMVGKNVIKYPNVVKDVYKRGFEIGNHSWDHSPKIGSKIAGYAMNRQEVSDELYKNQDAIYKLIGTEPHFFRPPYGAVNQTVFNANYLGYAFWDIDSKDWETLNADSVFNVVTQAAKKGNVLALIHDIHKPSMEAVMRILPYLHDQGYQFVTYSTLLKYNKKYLTHLDNDYGVPTMYANGR